MTAPAAPINPRILHADGTSQSVGLEYLGTEPLTLDGEIYIVPRFKVLGALMCEGDQITADWMPEPCGFVVMEVWAA